MRTITTRAELAALAQELGVRPDWHEPDEQNVTAKFGGNDLDFDNAMPPGLVYGKLSQGGDEYQEMCIYLHRLVIDEQGERRIGQPIAVVNLAMLFAWATGFQSDVDHVHDGRTQCGWEQQVHVLRWKLNRLMRELRSIAAGE